jgi:hypothetical protein
MSTKSRSRFDGGGESLAAVLKPFLVEGGKNFLKYDESPQVKKSPVDKDAIFKYSPMIHACKDLQNSLSFKKSTVDDAFKNLVNSEIASEWTGLVTEDLKLDWAKTMSVRLRNMLQGVTSSEAKKVGWTSELPWNRGKANPAGTSKGKKTKAATDVSTFYFYGWNSEMKLGFRVKAGDKNSFQENSLPPEVYDRVGTAGARSWGEEYIGEFAFTILDLVLGRICLSSRLLVGGASEPLLFKKINTPKYVQTPRK